MFLLHGKQSKVKQSGENAANYVNPEFDALFERMKAMENSPRRQEIIDRMTEILRHDAPWVFGFHPKDYSLRHAWLKNRKPSKVGHNTLKYQRVDAALRAQHRAEWNRPVVWPLLLVALALAAVIWPAWRGYRRRETATAR
jgi:oligopeptide transport system substrate-binding protein